MPQPAGSHLDAYRHQEQAKEYVIAIGGMTMREPS
jgi:hypothetical protein